MIDETHDAARTSWISSAQGHSDFPIQNLPFGIFSDGKGPRRPGVAIGDFILDLARVCKAGLWNGAAEEVLSAPCLNDLLAQSPEQRRSLRRLLSELLSDDRHRSTVGSFLVAAKEAVLHCPMTIGNYTDFYAGIHHAENVGRLFRPDNPLLPNYKYVPIGYHGRSSSIRISDTAVIRPNGQRKLEGSVPVFGPSERLDYELELGIWIGSGNALGKPIPIGEAEKHIAGFCLLNDWSARDLQAWEYQPLGPFLAKNFLTTISPWVVTAEALAPFRVAQPARPPGDPRPLGYLWAEEDQSRGALAIEMEVSLTTAKMRGAGLAPHRMSRTEATNLYWTPAQLVAHHTSNGCNLCSGDLFGSGTISASDPQGYGSILEITRGGQQPILLPGGETRRFLEDGDEVSLTARARREGYVPIGFGTCRGLVVPAP